MTKAFDPALGAALVLLLTAGSALAGAAVVSTDMTAHEGPGDEYKPVWSVVAGMQVDVRECDARQWCLVEHKGKRGWVHVRLATADAGGRAGGGSDGGGGTSGGGSTTGSDKGGSTTGGDQGGSPRSDHGPGGGGSGGGSVGDSASRDTPTGGISKADRTPSEQVPIYNQ